MHYKNEVENQLGKKIKAIRSDRGGEYDAPFDRFVKNLVLFTKLLRLIHLSKMGLLNIKIEH